MKKYLMFVISTLIVCAAMMARADSEVVDGVTWYYGTSEQWNSQTQQYDKYAYITSGADKYTGDLTVPSSLGGYAVKKIGVRAFYKCGSLTSVTMPEGITSIGEYAFADCSLLKSITIPKGVTNIGGWAFYGCSSLARVMIPEGVTSICNGTFYMCSSLTSVTIPEGVTSIGGSAFYVCRSLTSVKIPEGVTSINDYAFQCCSMLERFDVPASVTSIGEGVIQECDSLRTITVADGNANYKCVNNCIVSASGATLIAVPVGCEVVEIPDGVTEIPNDIFLSDNVLKYINIPNSVRSISRDAFKYCYASKEVNFSGAPPSGIENCNLLSYASNVSYPREYGGAWMKVINDIGKFSGYNRKQPDVTVLSSKIRVNDPTILDVVYKVTSAVTNTVKVRALAFEDGERSFAKVVRPETFVADTNGVETAGNVGDHVAANVEHTLSWKVSSDWSNQLAKVSFEVLATEGDLLPLEVRTIPASDQYGKMDVTWNAITESQWFDALLWLHADKNEKVTLSDGIYFYDGKVAAKDTAIYSGKTESDYYSRTRDPDTKQYVYVRYKNAPEVVLEEMGYTVLSGEVLNYVNEETRLGLSPSGTRQYGYKIVSEK